MPTFPVYVYFIAISFLASLSIFIRPATSLFYLKLFPPFLLATLCIEAWGSYLYAEGKHTVFIYNYFTVVEFCFYLFILYLIINNARVKRLILFTMVAFVLASAGNIFFIQGTATFHTNTYSIGCLLLVAVCIYYFLELFRSPTSIKLTSNPAFWICSSLLFFYCCSFPAYAIISLGRSIPQIMVENLADIFTVLNILLYSLFTIAFLCIRNLKFISSRR